MKTSVLFITGLCILSVGCGKKTQATNTGGTPQIQAPVAPPAPAPKPVATAKAEPPKPAAQPKQAPAAAPVKRLDEKQRADLNQMLAKLEDAFFDYNQTTIRTDATAALTDNIAVIRSILADYPAEKLLIEGHADERGSSEYNLALADRRSRAAQEFLASRGIPQSQLSVLSLGEERPVCKDPNEACYQKNRRVHITVAP
ncbi:MAG: OmpA family protein [Acidobacteriota bacterium]